MDWKKEKMTIMRNHAGGVKEGVQFSQQQDEILPMTQMAQEQKYRTMSLFFQHDSESNEDRGKTQVTADSVPVCVGDIPSSLSELCFQMQQRIQKCVLQPTSPEDQKALMAVMASELGLIWQDLRGSKPDPMLTWSENRVLQRDTFSEVLRLCEQLYLSYLHLQHSLRRRAVFTAAANRSRLAAQMASDCTSMLNVHSIRRGISTRIKAERQARLSAGKNKAGVEQQRQPSVSATSPDGLTLSLPRRKMQQLINQHRLSVQRDIGEIKEKIGDLDLEGVYELMPYCLEKTVDLNITREEKESPDEDLPAVPAENEMYSVCDGLYTRLKGCRSMPDLSRETLLEELEMEAPPPRPESPLVLMATRRPVTQKQTLNLADDLKRLLQDDSSLDNTDPDLDIPPLIKARSYKSSANLQKLQALLQRLREKREHRERSRLPLRKPEHPQADVISVPISSQATARLAAPRVSDRMESGKIHISMFPPVYNDVNREIEVSSVQWMDRNLFAGAEIKEVCKELSKSLMNQYLGFEEDPLIQPYIMELKSRMWRKTPYRLINAALKNSISSKKRVEAPVDHKKPLDTTSRAYAAWFQWWKSHLSLDDYLRYITTQELDYLAVVFHLHDSEAKQDTEEEKMRALQQQRDEKKRTRTEKIKALKRIKQEYVMGVWNVNSVLLGGLWKDPVLEEDDSPDELEAPVVKQRSSLFQEQSEVPVPADVDQLKARLERVWTVLFLPDASRLDMAIKYSSQAYRDQMEKAIVHWEQAARLIQQRETVLSKLELFEWEASDPTRFFRPGYHGTAVARMNESKQREKLNLQMASLEKKLNNIISRLSDCFRDTVTYKGRPYREKMRWDRTEMLYWLQQEGRVQSLERVVTRQGVQPARLPPLELARQYCGAHPTPQGSGPKDHMPHMSLCEDKLQPARSVSHIQVCVSSSNLGDITK